LASRDTIVVSPGQSIDAALDSARPGDVIQIRAGTYTENVSSGVDGTNSKPITLEPYPGERPVLHVKLTLSGASYLSFRNLLFEGSSGVSGTAVRFDSGTRRVIFEGNEVRNYRTSGSAQAFLLGGASGTAVAHISLLRNHIHDNGVADRHDHGVYCQNSVRALMDGNRIENMNRGYGIQLYSSATAGCDDAVIRNCTIRASLLSGIVISRATDRALIESNLITDHTRTTDGSFGYAVRQGAGIGNGNIVRDNIGERNARDPDFLCPACSMSGNISG
jgi:nitrous oxidase accessory protein NosD